MPLVIRCEHCQAPLKLPEEFVGRSVRCPSCQQEFVAKEDPVQPPPPRREEPEDQPDLDDDRGRPPRRRDDEDDRPARSRSDDYDEDDRPRRRLRRGYYGDGERTDPHRGGAIQTLGILSMCLFCMPIISITMAIIALVMAGTDLSRMRAGYMDRSGEGATNTGKTCAIIGLIVSACYLLVVFCFACAGGAGGGRH